MCALPALPALATAQGTLALRMQPTIAGVPDGKSGVPAPVYMEGDRMQGHSERETEALGNARARSRGQAIAADWMRFDSRFNELTAIGNVQLEQGAYVAQGVRLRYDFDTERGVMERAKYFINPRATGNLPIAAVPSGVMPTASTSPNKDSTMLVFLKLGLLCDSCSKVNKIALLLRKVVYRLRVRLHK